MLWLSQLLTQVISTQDACHYRKRQLWKPGANVTFSRFLRISNTSWNTRYRVSRQGDVREQELFLCACFPTFLYWNINDILGTNQSLSFRDASTLLELLTLTSFFSDLHLWSVQHVHATVTARMFITRCSTVPSTTHTPTVNWTWAPFTWHTTTFSANRITRPIVPNIHQQVVKVLRCIFEDMTIWGWAVALASECAFGFCVQHICGHC